MKYIPINFIKSRSLNPSLTRQWIIEHRHWISITSINSVALSTNLSPWADIRKIMLRFRNINPTFRWMPLMEKVRCTTSTINFTNTKKSFWNGCSVWITSLNVRWIKPDCGWGAKWSENIKPISPWTISVFLALSIDDFAFNVMWSMFGNRWQVICKSRDKKLLMCKKIWYGWFSS